MQYITTHQIPHFVRDRILQVIAIMVKRASIDDHGRERGTILQEVENLIMNAEPDKVKTYLHIKSFFNRKLKH